MPRDLWRRERIHERGRIGDAFAIASQESNDADYASAEPAPEPLDKEKRSQERAWAFERARADDDY